ncbi:MAG: hypothetical protein J2P25_14295 [Nocardiopsaceae bacterium]|nr:hypothetical protein [Nocardiopsaceae bacterium]
MVRSVARRASRDGYSRVAVQGAIDAEPGFGPFPHFRGWEWGDKSGPGYVSKSSSIIDDYGSADGCPQALGESANRKCGDGWTLADEYDAVWGWGPNEGTPEIYFDGCHGYANDAHQWANVSAYGNYHRHKGKVRFVGPLDQGSCLNAGAAWRKFQAALAADNVPESMKFSAEITR